MMYLDVDLIYALIKKGDRHFELAKETVSRKEEIYTSIVSFVELEILIKREISNELSMNLQGIVKEKIPRLKIRGLDLKIFELSLQLRRKFGLGIFDSIHAATALTHDKRIASTDRIYERIKGLKKIVKEILE